MKEIRIAVNNTILCLDAYILCRDTRTRTEFRLIEEMTGWVVEIVKFKPVAEII